MKIFKSRFDKKLNGKVETQYIFQDFDLSKFGIRKKIYREKPWET